MSNSTLSVAPNGCARSFTLNDGHRMPAFGLGTWKSKSDGEAARAVECALENGYRHIDCACIYSNEQEIGPVFESFTSGETPRIDRSELWITSKLWCTFWRREAVRLACELSVKNLRCGYLDLYLIHFPWAFSCSNPSFAVENWPTVLDGANPIPFPRNEDGSIQLDTEVTLEETWKAMEELVRDGLVKSIGVSNFSIKQLQHLLSFCEIRPFVNQIEVHPYFRQDELIAFCKSEGIHVTAYSPLGTPDSQEPGAPVLLEEPVLARVAERHETTPATVCLRYALERDLSVIPKSVTPSRIVSNLSSTMAISLSDADLKDLASIEFQHRFNDPSKWWKFQVFDDSPSQNL